MQERGSCFSMGLETLSGPEGADGERFVATVKNSAEEKGKEKRNESLQKLSQVVSAT